MSATFELRSRPSWTNGRDIPLGLYELPRRSGDAHLYRLNHPLGEAVVERAKARQLSPGEVTFDYTNHVGRISALEPLRGRERLAQRLGADHRGARHARRPHPFGRRRR